MSFILPPRTITFSPATASTSFPADRAERGVTGATIDAALTHPTQHPRADRAERLGGVAAPVFHEFEVSDAR